MQTNQATAKDCEAHVNGLAAARDAFLDDDKTLTVYRPGNNRRGKRVYGNLDDRLARAIEAYAQRQL